MVMKMYNQNVNNFFFKENEDIKKKKKMKCTKGMEIYTNIKSGICFQCKKIGCKEVLREVTSFHSHSPHR